jgi:hypothetical protein
MSLLLLECIWVDQLVQAASVRCIYFCIICYSRADKSHKNANNIFELVIRVLLYKIIMLEQHGSLHQTNLHQFVQSEVCLCYVMASAEESTLC